MGSDHHAALSADLYDAVGQIWLQLFGEHVHVGYYQAGYPDSKRSKTWQQAQRDHIDAILDFAGVKQATKLVDLGCGYGGTAVHIAERLKCKTVGINISPFQVQAANRLAKRLGFSQDEVHFVVGDALKPDLPDGAFDLVISVEAAAYMPDKEQFVQQLARLCSPGGSVVLVDFCRAPGDISKSLAERLSQMDDIFATPGNWHSAEQYKKLMGDSGLSVEGDADWTLNVCGFWNVGLWHLLFRSSRPGLGFMQWFIEFSIRAWTVLWLFIVGGPAVLKMGLGYLFGQQKRVVQGGFDTGVLEYHVITAKKASSTVTPGGTAGRLKGRRKRKPAKFGSMLITAVKKCNALRCSGFGQYTVLQSFERLWYSAGRRHNSLAMNAVFLNVPWLIIVAVTRITDSGIQVLLSVISSSQTQFRQHGWKQLCEWRLPR